MNNFLYIFALFVLVYANTAAASPFGTTIVSNADKQVTTTDNDAREEGVGGETAGGENESANPLGGGAVDPKTVSWSFRIHPHPRKFEYSDEQNQIWEDALMGKGRAVEICDDLLEAEYEVYKLHYPDFAAQELSLEPKLHRAWRDHLVIEQYHLPSMCMINSAHARVLELLRHLEWVNFRFCGAVAAPVVKAAQEVTSSGASPQGASTKPPPSPPVGPQTFDEDYLAAGLNQMLAFSALGAPEAIVNALYYAAMHPNLALNADVEYFLRMSLRRTRRFEQHWQVAHLRTSLTGERLAFVDQAVKRGDLKAVRQTSAACPDAVPRPQPTAIRAAQ